MQKTCVIYCRVSTPEQRKNNLSLESQEKSCLQYAKQNGLSVLGVFAEDVSGESHHRVEFEKAKDLIKTGKVDFFITTKTDRLGRDDIIELPEIRRICSQYNTTIKLTDQGLSDRESESNLNLSMYGAFASYEKEIIKERTMSGKKALLSANKFVQSGHIPFGFFKNKKTRELEIAENEAEIVKKIFAVYSKPERTLSDVAESLNKEKIPTPSMRENYFSENKKASTKWKANQIQRILANPIYINEYFTSKIRYKRKQIRLENGKWKTYTEKTEKPPNEWIKLDVEKIIKNKSLFDSIQKKLTRNRNFAKKKSNRTYLFRGIVFCDCEPINPPFVGYTATKTQTAQYRCNRYNKSKFGKDRYCKNYISEAKIILNVWEAILDFFANGERLLNEYDESVEKFKNTNKIKDALKN